MEVEQRKKLMQAALGREEPDLVLKYADIVDVYTEKLYTADIAVKDGYIAGVGAYHGAREVDMTGRIVVPGFIDSHVHIESSMVAPDIFAKKVLPYGTTTVIADPHEIANVAGLDGIRYFLADSENCGLNVYFMLPSCVPLNEFDHNGGVFGTEQMAELLGNPRVAGLGEVMNYEAVVSGDETLLNKIELLRDKVIDGHSPGLSGKKLQAYRLAGIETDHECFDYASALERLRAGFVVQIREGSAARNLAEILSGAIRDGISLENCVFCTDDLHLADVAKQGHINHNIKMAVDLGLDPIKAIKMATLNPARVYRLKELGAVAPGFRADLVVLDSLEDITVLDVYKDGASVNGGGFSLTAVHPDDKLTHSVHIPPLDKNCFQLQVRGEFPVIEVVPGQIITRRVNMILPNRNGIFTPTNDLLKIAVVQRHDGSGRTGLGVVKGFGLHNGAVASTVAHDAHNLIVIGDNDDDMLAAVEELKNCGGGYTVVSGGKVLKTLPLPIAGLFTDDGSVDMICALNDMAVAAHSMGVPEDLDVFLNLSFMALPVIPELRITDEGLFDVLQNRFLPKEPV
ncbi:MAG TPA: adenine deaminase [Caproiciproducens sp.]|nr:adenine deaminase [Caproiciproducens sp.]